MIIYQVDEDLVTSRGHGDAPGVPGPAHAGVPLERLRFDGAAIVDLHDLAEGTFWIDAAGRKRLASGAGRQSLPCAGATAIERSGETWVAVGAAEAARRELVAYAERKKWAKKVGGIVVGGLPVRTDDATRTEIGLARSDAALDPAWSTEWKLGNGTYVTLDGATINAIAAAVSAHVRACFATGADVAAEIAAGTITSTAEIDAAFDD